MEKEKKHEMYAAAIFFMSIFERARVGGFTPLPAPQQATTAILYVINFCLQTKTEKVIGSTKRKKMNYPSLLEVEGQI